jgi:hypothetical protein
LEQNFDCGAHAWRVWDVYRIVGAHAYAELFGDVFLLGAYGFLFGNYDLHRFEDVSADTDLFQVGFVWNRGFGDDISCHCEHRRFAGDKQKRVVSVCARREPIFEILG